MARLDASSDGTLPRCALERMRGGFASRPADGIGVYEAKDVNFAKAGFWTVTTTVTIDRRSHRSFTR